MKKALDKGVVFLNGTRAYTADYVSGGEIIDLYREEGERDPIELSIKIKVLFEDNFFAVVHKPAGIVVSGNRKWTVENALRYHLKRSSQNDYLVNPQAIHRLDYPTTGVLLIGKTLDATTKLNQLFEHRKIHKTYYAITVGKMQKSGKIALDVDGKPAVSDYVVEKSVTSKKFEYLNLVKVKPTTGRKHQIRKHLYSIGNPILGDKDYFNEGFLHKGKGLYLHASALEFNHPYLNKIMKIESPLPEKFTSIFQSYDK